MNRIVLEMRLPHSEELDILFEGILLLKNMKECRAFFEDLCTVRELDDMAQRSAVALRLNNGECYSSISDETGASSATISRVARCLNYGAGGYRTVMDKIGSGDGEEL